MVCTTYLAGKHVRSTAALWGYTVSIIAFIKSSLVPISEYLYFLLLC